jgi:hypothetical protein
MAHPGFRRHNEGKTSSPEAGKGKLQVAAKATKVAAQLSQQGRDTRPRDKAKTDQDSQGDRGEPADRDE